MVSPNDDPEQNKIINEIKYDLPCNEYSELKPGIKLPKTIRCGKKLIRFSEVNFIQKTLMIAT